jgi:hypothetical protein
MTIADMDRMAVYVRHAWRALARYVQALVLIVPAALAGCAALSNAVIAIDSADPSDTAGVSMIMLDQRSPALLRAVDAKMIEGVHVPSALRSFTFVLRPGPHELWMSSVPAGLPWLPQRIDCYVVRAVLAAGSRYVLSIDKERDLAVLSGSELTGSPATGTVVDRPFVFERSCRWQAPKPPDKG